MTSLDLKAAFFHVIDDHRWLAASGCTWNLVGANVTGGTKTEAHRLLPNIDVVALDSLLLHARSLIKFYRSSGGRGNDILLSHFAGLKISSPLETDLGNYQKPIEVHLLHLTDWRDSGYRNSNSRNAAKFRPDWDTEATRIVELIFGSLEYVSNQGGLWQQPFKALYKASDGRYRDKSYPWPCDLGEKTDVEDYLKRLGL